MGYAKHVGRVGALAVALGIGTAVITTPGIAWADEPGASSKDGPSQNAPAGGAGETGGQNTTTGGDTTPDANTGSNDPTPTGITTTVTTATTTGSTTTTTVGGGSTPEVSFGSSTVTGSIGTTHKVPPSSAADVPLIVESSAPSTLQATTVVSTPAPTPVQATPTATVEQTLASLTAPPNGASTPQALANALALAGISSASAGAGVPTGQVTPQAFAARFVAPNVLDDSVTANTLQDNTFEALVAPTALPVPSVPPPSLVDTVLAIPGTIISTALNLITQALSPLIGPGAPADNPVLWAVLAFVRRQFNQGFVNSTPVLAPQQTSLGLSPVTGTFGATDADGDTLTYSVPTTGLGAPAHGTVTINQAAGTFTYTPTAGYVGADYFFVTATDGAAGSHIHALGQTHAAAARVDVTVTDTSTPLNHAPVAVDDAFRTDEDTAFITGNVLLNDYDVDAGTRLRAGLESTKATEKGGTVSINNDGTFTYTPKLDFNGVDTFTYTVKDNSGVPASNSGVGTVTMTVTPINDAPTLSVVQEAAGAPNGAVKITATYNDVDDTTLTGFISAPQYGYYAATIDGPALSFAGTSTAPVAVGGTTNVAYYIPTGSGTETLTFTLKDAGNLEVSRQLTIVNEVVNQNPSGTVYAYDPDEDGNVLIEVIGSDPEGDTVTVFYPVDLATGTLTPIDDMDDPADLEEGQFAQYYLYTPYAQSRLDAYDGTGPTFETLSFDFTDENTDAEDYDYDTDDYTTTNVDVTISPAAALLTDVIDISDVAGSSQLLDTFLNPVDGHLYAAIVRPSADDLNTSVTSVFDLTTGTLVGDAFSSESNNAASFYGLYAEAAADAAGNVYVVKPGTNTFNTSVVILHPDGSTEEIPVDGLATQLFSTRDGSHVYLTTASPNSSDNATFTVLVADLATGDLGGDPYIVGGAALPYLVLFNRQTEGADGTIYSYTALNPYSGASGLQFDDTVISVRHADGSTETLTTDGFIASLAGDPQGDHLYATLYHLPEGQTDVVGEVVDLSDNSVVTGATTSNQSVAQLQVTPDGKRLIAVTSQRATVIDIATQTVIATVDLPYGTGAFLRVTLNGDGTKAYLSYVTASGAPDASAVLEISLAGPAATTGVGHISPL